jgi:hypothetical protein
MDMIDRVIDHGIGKLYGKRRRCRGQRIRHSGSRHADRAKIIGVAVRRMIVALPAIGRNFAGDQCKLALGAGSIWRVDVTEGERKVDGKRDKREPRTKPELFPKPEHQVIIIIRGSNTIRAGYLVNWGICATFEYFGL